MEMLFSACFVIQFCVMIIKGFNPVVSDQNVTTTFCILNSSVVMECPMDKIDENPSWSRQDELLAFGKNIRNNTQQYNRLRLVGQDNNQYNLMILRVTQSDEDKYCCISAYNNNSVQYCTRLNLIALNVIPHQDKTVHGIEGESVSLSCSLTKVGVNGNLTWIYIGAVLNNQLTDTINVSVTLSKEYHKQTIRCRAYIQVINASLEEILTFNISYKPSVKILVHPSAVLKENYHLFLTCSYDSNPIASQSIWVTGEQIVSTEPEYNVRNVSRRHSGLYRCIVENDVGSGIDEVKITVLYAPDVNVVQLLNGSLYCNATGIPMNYTFLKWEHQSFNGQHLRYLQVESAMLTVDLEDDNTVYNQDGRYWCTVTNGVPDDKNISPQIGYIDVYWPGRPWCIMSNSLPQYGQQKENITVIFHVYSYSVLHFDWFKSDVKLEMSPKYKFSSNNSSSSMKVFGRDVQIETKIFSLEIFSATENDFNAYYILRIHNNYGNESCLKRLLESSIPHKPTYFEVKAYKNSFLVSWLSGFDGGHPQIFVIIYRFVVDENWLLNLAKAPNCTSERICTTLITGILKDGLYIVYMYAENILGKSTNTKPVTVEVHAFEKDNEKQNQNLFSQTKEKLVITLIAALLLIVIFILCCLLCSEFRKKRTMILPSSRNQGNTIDSNRHYEEIDGDLEINGNNSLSPVNVQIDNQETPEAEHLLTPPSIQTMKEIVERTMRDISIRVLTETTTKMVRDTQLNVIRETLQQVLNENNVSQLTNRRSSLSSESEYDTNDENHGTGYLNPYQPLLLNANTYEHPYTETALNDGQLDTYKRENKNCSTDTFSFHFKKAASV